MQRQGMKEPVLLQGDFRKVSGISSEIFRQIEAVENDHDPSTAAALEVSCLVLAISIEIPITTLIIPTGCRKTRRDDCKDIGASLHWKSSIL